MSHYAHKPFSLWLLVTQPLTFISFMVDFHFLGFVPMMRKILGIPWHFIVDKGTSAGRQSLNFAWQAGLKIR